MLRYNIKQAVSKPKGTRILVPITQPSLAFERAYLAALRRLLTETATAMREIILPAYGRSPLRASDAQLIGDADSASFGSFTLLVNALSRTVTQRVEELLGLEVKRHTKKWLENAKRAFGVDLRGIVQEENLEAYLEAVALRNAGLIKGLSDDLIKRVQQDTINSLVGGESVNQLKERLKHSLDVSDSRARLIAYDQTSKLNADLTKARNKEAGIDSYVWRTSMDERVRPRHAALEGKQYKYGEPTGAEDGLEPGQPIRCRCNAQAVVDWSDLDDKPKAKQAMVAEEVAPEPTVPGKKPMSPAQTAALAKAQQASKAKGEATKKAAAEAKAALKAAKEKAKQEAAAAVAAAKLAAQKEAAALKIAEATAAAKKKAAGIKAAQQAAAKSTLPDFNPTSLGYQEIGNQFPRVAEGAALLPVHDYVGSGYRGMNAYFRTGGKEGGAWAGRARELKKTIDKSPIPTDIKAFRGVGQITDLLPGVTDVSTLLGATIEDKGFMSVATNSKVSVNFARGNNRNPPPPPLMIEYRLRKGQKGLHVGRQGLRYDETEIILPPGTKLRVIEAKKATGQVGAMFDYVSVEVIDD